MLNFSLHEKGVLPEDLWGKTSALRAQPAGIPAAVLSGGFACVSSERFWPFSLAPLELPPRCFAKRRVPGPSSLSNAEKSRRSIAQGSARFRRLRCGEER